MRLTPFIFAAALVTGLGGHASACAVWVDAEEGHYVRETESGSFEVLFDDELVFTCEPRAIEGGGRQAVCDNGSVGPLIFADSSPHTGDGSILVLNYSIYYRACD